MSPQKCLAMLALISSIAALPMRADGGDPTYPSSVQADGQGNWTATIHVTGTTNPMFSNDPPVNTTLTSVVQVHNQDGSFDITLGGTLINRSKNGSITFQVDPEGILVSGMITITPAPIVPTLTEVGLIALVLIMVTVGISMLRRKQRMA